MLPGRKREESDGSFCRDTSRGPPFSSLWEARTGRAAWHLSNCLPTATDACGGGGARPTCPDVRAEWVRRAQQHALSVAFADLGLKGLRRGPESYAYYAPPIAENNVPYCKNFDQSLTLLSQLI